MEDMIVDATLNSTFDILNKNIDYVVLRGYIPTANLSVIDDIDIFVNPDCKKKLRGLLLKRGWARKKIHTGKYPQDFFIYKNENNEKQYMIHATYGIFYGDFIKRFVNEEKVLRNRQYRWGIYTPNPKEALALYILRLIFDKKELADKEKEEVLKLFNDFNKYKEKNNIVVAKEYEDLLLIVKEIVNSCILNGDTIIKKEKNRMLIESKYLSYSYFQHIGGFLKSKFNRYCLMYPIILMKKTKNIIINIFSNNNICILGIDGSGKSSTVEALKLELGDKYIVQYMGSRKDVEVRSSSGNTKIQFKNFCTSLLERWYRVVKHWPHNKSVIYDRYAWDKYVSLNGKKRFLVKTFFKYLFPKPKYIFYLHCSVETSLSRKDDIDNVEDFKKLKSSFDNAYLNMKCIKSINTEENNIETTVNLILDSLDNKKIKMDAL